MEVSSPATLSTPAGTITFNNDGDLYVFTKLDGFDDPELRVTVDNKSRQDGGVIHAIYAAAIHGTCEGWVLTGDPATRNDAEDALGAALRSIRTVDGTFTVTPTGQGAKSLTVRQDGSFQTAIVNGTLHSFQFGLVAADPFWA
jgi:hypothetical protein